MIRMIKWRINKKRDNKELIHFAGQVTLMTYKKAPVIKYSRCFCLLIPSQSI